MYLINLLVAIALGIVVSKDIEQSLGHSLAANRLLDGYDDLWFQGFSRDAEGLSKTFHPAVSGIGGIFEGLDVVLSGKFGQMKGVLGIALMYALMWVYFSAGFIGMFYNGSPDGVFGQHFFAEAGRHFMRFLVLSVIAAVIYWLMLGVLLPAMGTYVTNIHRNTILEPLVFRDTAIKYAAIWLLIFFFNQVFDYSKVLVIVHDVRKQDIWRVPIYATYFLIKHPLKTGLLFLMLIGTSLGFLLLYWIVAPGAWQASWFTILFAFLLGQIYIFGRVAIRCLFYASETGLYYYEAVLPATEARQLPEKIERR